LTDCAPIVAAGGRSPPYALGVFEKVYRFTPFTEDAQSRIRNRCSLELAGHDVANLPMAHICRGWALHWPPDAFQEVLPNA